MIQFGLPFDLSDLADLGARLRGRRRARSVAPPVRPVVTPAAPVVPTPSAPSSDSGDVYFVRHHRARRYVMRFDLEGRIRVTIPRGGSRREAEAFVRRHAAWVAEQRARPRPAAMAPAEQRRLREQARAEFTPRLLAFAAQFGLTVSRVSIRNQRSRWGSCGPDGHISLNWRLLKMPTPVQDYVLIHELMHLRQPNHSPAYWKLVAEACPGYVEARRWLNTHGRHLG